MVKFASCFWGKSPHVATGLGAPVSDMDWMGSDFGVQVDTPELVQPPRIGVLATFIISIVSVLLAFVDARFGYLAAVIASSVGGFTAVSDQKKRADSNYVSYTWFMPALRFIRYFALIVALMNIGVLAVEVARGGSLL